MWFIITIALAVAAYAAVIIFDSVIPPVLFLIGAVIFMVISWKKAKRK